MNTVCIFGLSRSFLMTRSVRRYCWSHTVTSREIKMFFNCIVTYKSMSSSLWKPVSVVSGNKFKLRVNTWPTHLMVICVLCVNGWSLSNVMFYDRMDVAPGNDSCEMRSMSFLCLFRGFSKETHCIHHRKKLVVKKVKYGIRILFLWRKSS